MKQEAELKKITFEKKGREYIMILIDSKGNKQSYAIKDFPYPGGGGPVITGEYEIEPLK